MDALQPWLTSFTIDPSLRSIFTNSHLICDNAFNLYLYALDAIAHGLQYLSFDSCGLDMPHGGA